MDTPLSWDEVDDALTQALDLEAEERAHYLATLTPPLRAAVEELLTVALAEHPVLDHPDAVLQPLLHTPTASAVEKGTRVGPYRIEALVGEGGMGRVYRARRDDGAFNKTVALKVVRHSLALAGSDVAARLRRERDLLAALDHPGIARLLDGGETPDGVPYLVTEFIDGLPMTAWADAQNASVQQRVQLLVEVAEAVDHAHRRFVIHRDLKPSNVMVTEQDGTPRVAVLDFGIAKLLEVADEAGSLAFPLTQTGLRMLTPAYAAPELFDPATVPSTAVDVYGLGALLYEVLTGFRPHETAPAGVAPVGEPTRPSQAVTTLAAEREVAYDAVRRARALEGDLDTICLKALHPDPARRYLSAGALVEDLQRYLQGRPIAARPDSVLYVFSRFARRNRAAVFAASMAIVLLVAGLTTSLILLERTVDAATRAQSAVTMLKRLFEMPYIDEREVTVREMMEYGVQIMPSAAPTPEAHAYLLSVIADSYLQIGEMAKADSVFALALDIFATVDDPFHESTSMAHSGYAYTRGRLGDPESAIVHYKQAYADAGYDQQVGTYAYYAIADLPYAYLELERYDEALEAAEYFADEINTDDLVKVGHTQYVKGDVLAAMGRAPEATALYELAWSTARSVFSEAALNPDTLHFSTINPQCALGRLLVHHQDRLDEAETYLQRCRMYWTDQIGENDETVVDMHYRLGLLTLMQQRYDESERFMDAALLGSRSRDNAYPQYLPLHGLAALRLATAQYASAETAAREAQALAASELGDTSWVAVQAQGQLGLALYHQQEDAEARTHLAASNARYLEGQGRGRTPLENKIARNAQLDVEQALKTPR